MIKQFAIAGSVMVGLVSTAIAASPFRYPQEGQAPSVLVRAGESDEAADDALPIADRNLADRDLQTQEMETAPADSSFGQMPDVLSVDDVRGTTMPGSPISGETISDGSMMNHSQNLRPDRRQMNVRGNRFSNERPRGVWLRRGFFGGR